MPVVAGRQFWRPVLPAMSMWLPFGPSAHRRYRTQPAHHSAKHLPLCRGCPRITPDALMQIVPCRHFRNSMANKQPAYSRRLEVTSFLAPPDDGLETMATLARSVLGRKLANRCGVLDCRKLTALRAGSTAGNPVWWRVVSLHVCRRFQWLHFFHPFTNFSAFLPEITPFCGLFSAIFSARFRSDSNTEWPTNAR